MLILEDAVPFSIHTLAFSPDGGTLASINGRSTRVRLWDLETRKVCEELDGHSGRVVAVAFSGSGEMVVTATSVGQLWLWQWMAGQPEGPRLVRQLDWRRSELTKAPGQIVFAPDGDTFATNIQDVTTGGNAVHLVALSGARIDVPTGHVHEVSCLAFSPDGRFLATGSYDRSVRLNDRTTGHTTMILNQGMKTHYIAFSPDSITLASGSPQGLVKVWDATTGKKRCTLKGQAMPLFALCYSPDGRFIATAGGEGTVAFWDVATSRSRTAFDWGIGDVHSVAFAPDGMRAAAGGMGKIVVWDIDDWDV